MAAETLVRRLFDGGPRVAVVHEWIDAYAGSEQVFEAIARAFPAADLYALTRDPGVDLALGGRPVRTTALDRPGLRGRRALTLPLMPLAWRALGRGDYDVVVSSHHAFAHANRLVRPGGVHLAYVHTPARYVWSPEVDGRGRGALLAPARAVLRAADRRASRRVTAYAANSTTVARRIADCWGRSARVIAPPVRVQHFAAGAAGATRGGYVLGVGRWVGYKNLHRVIEAADLAGLPVTIAGRGPDRSRIEAAARAATVPVELVESPSDDVLRDLYQRAACLVFPTVEDFGLVPVEAQAAGTPVVGPAAGGLLDTVHDGVTGVLTRTADPADLARGVRATRSLDRAACREQAERFSAERFAVRLTAWVREVSAPARPLPRVAAGR